ETYPAVARDGALLPFPTLRLAGDLLHDGRGELILPSTRLRSRRLPELHHLADTVDPALPTSTSSHEPVDPNEAFAFARRHGGRHLGVRRARIAPQDLLAASAQRLETGRRVRPIEVVSRPPHRLELELPSAAAGHPDLPVVRLLGAPLQATAGADHPNQSHFHVLRARARVSAVRPA